MATIRAFLKHTHVGKQSQAEPYTAAAHARYVSRRNAASLIYSERMPKQYHAVQRFLNAHEDGLRKNGRVIDKFIISVPTDVSAEDAAKALKRFGFRLGQGRTPFLFALHGFETQNHHAHFIFIDRDIETGKRVFGTTLLDSSAAIKLEWETAANETFAELGYDIRIEVKQGYEVANDNEPLEPEAEVDTVEDTAPVSEEDMAVDDRAHDDTISLAANYLRLLDTTQRELGYLRHSQQALEFSRSHYASLVTQRERASFDAGVYEAQTLPILQTAHQAQEKLAQHQKANGKLKGIGVKLFGYEIKTGARKQAETALQDAEAKQGQAAYVERKRGEFRSRIDTLDAQATQAETDAYLKQQELLATYGTDEDMVKAEQELTTTISKAIQAVPLEYARNAYDDGEVTAAEYRAYLLSAGHAVQLADFDEELGMDSGESL